MKKSKLNLFIFQTVLIILFLSNFVFCIKTQAQIATITDNFTVNSSLVISDATTEANNPTLNVNISVTPDVGASAASGSANFRLRTNQAMWTLTATKGAFSAGTTGIAQSDITLALATSAGSTANASAGTRAFVSNTLNNITTTTLVSGTAKTSSSRDSTNTNNYFQVNSTYSINQDFFFTPGSATVPITYTFTSP